LPAKDRAKAKSQADVWEQVLVKNEINKANAVSVPELNDKRFPGGPQLDQSWSYETTEINEVNMNLFFETSLEVDAKVEVAGSGVGGGFYAKAKLGFDKTRTESQTNSTVIGYHIEDGESGDLYVVDVKRDPEYGTPVFELDEETGDFKIPDLNEPELWITTAKDRLENLFTEAYNVLFQIIQTAPTHFQQSLQRNDHRPHITLFLAFLELFQLIQNDLNQLPRRHLDFYYKEVLQLKTKAAIADKVHLFFELAKNIEEHELKKAVRFKAGKDSEGNDLFYTLDQDGVFNKAQVVDIKTISKQNANQLHAAPIANSVDGKGGKFSKTETNPAWMTLGGEATPKASIGFAIASRELLLAEGERTVTITLNEDGFEFPSSKNNLTVELSGEKDWIPVTLSTDATLASNVLKFTLDAAVPPVVPFDAKKLKMELGTTLPVLRILLPEETDYEAWKEQTIEKIELTVDVSGVTNILAFNDLGPIDPSNSFLPFGPVPKKGSSLYIGSKEAFQKSLTSVTLNLEWEGLPDFSI
ncbi:MAG: hypothetical protein AAF705_21720, partial [Bacteroidota bacterium]